MSVAIYYVEVNLICIVVLALLLGSLPGRKIESKRSEYYKIMLILTMILCASDLFSGLFRGAKFAGTNIILWISNSVFMLSQSFIGYFWIIYSMQVLTGKLNKKLLALVNVVVLVDCILILTAPFNEWIFTIDAKNLYHRGDLMVLHWIIMYAFELIPSIVAPFTKAERREKRAIMLFVILPTIATILQSIFYGVTSGQAGIMCGLILLYIMLQNIEVSEARTRAELLDEISSTDTLTGLRNRRAYELELDLKQNEEWIGVAFMDLNGLKQTNDTLGHKAGDAMIARFAQLLRLYFKQEYIFRISGDEFIILCSDKTIFESQYKKMKIEMADQASSGCAEGPGKEIMHLVTEAERLMYKDKSDYYIRTGKDRRNR